MTSFSRIVVLATLLLAAACDQPDDTAAVLSDVPPRLRDGARVAFILTDERAQAVDRTVGEALMAKDITVILAKRPEDQPWETYLVGVKENIRQLWARGVQAANISVIGRGGNGLQALVLASLVREGNTRYAVVGACPREGAPGWTAFSDILELNGPRMEGQTLSLVHAKAVDSGSCQPVFDRASALEGWETDLSERAEPKAFEEPSPLWIGEVAAWISE